MDGGWRGKGERYQETDCLMLRMGQQLQGDHVHPLGLTGTVFFQGWKLEEEEPGFTEVLRSQHSGARQCLFNQPFTLHFEVPFWDFSGGPVADTLHSQCRGPSLIPGQGTGSHMPQLKKKERSNIQQRRSKNAPATAEIRHSQINK